MNPLHDGDVPATALYYTASGEAQLRAVPTRPTTHQVDEPFIAMAAIASAISVGTERLVSAGAIPPAEWQRMRAPRQIGEFPFPVAYGYALVGRIVTGPEPLIGRLGFALAPHITRIDLPLAACSVVPRGIPPRRAALAANMETALNAVWDASALPGMRCAVVGGGAVGLLAATLLAALPGTRVTLIDINPSREALAQALGCRFALPESAPRMCDVVLHVSASAAGLATAIACCGREATLVEASWYGTAVPPVPLGGAFHSGRLRIISSQVGRVAPAMRPRWSRRRRLAAALRLLDDVRLDGLLGEDIALAQVPARLADIFSGRAGIVPTIRY